MLQDRSAIYAKLNDHPGSSAQVCFIEERLIPGRTDGVEENYALNSKIWASALAPLKGAASPLLCMDIRNSDTTGRELTSVYLALMGLYSDLILGTSVIVQAPQTLLDKMAGTERHIKARPHRHIVLSSGGRGLDALAGQGPQMNADMMIVVAEPGSQTTETGITTQRAGHQLVVPADVSVLEQARRAVTTFFPRPK